MSMDRIKENSFALLCTAYLGSNTSSQNPVNAQSAVTQNGKVTQSPGTTQNEGQQLRTFVLVDETKFVN